MRAIMNCVVAAAFALASASAYAQTSSKASGGANLGSAQLYAFVNASGAVDETVSKGTAPCAEISGTCLGTLGNYRVRFTRDVTQCAIMGSLGVLLGTPDTPGFITASASSEFPNAVRVATYSANGNPASKPFRILVVC